MIISVEISLYPLDKNYAHAIRKFIDKLAAETKIRIKVQAMSTIIIGEYDIVFETLTQEIKSVFEQGGISVSVLKIANLDLSDQ